MTRFKRILALVCAILMLVCAVSCSKDPGAKDNETAAPSADTPLEVVVVKEKSKFRNVSFDGRNFIYVCEVVLENKGSADENVTVTALFDWEKEQGILESAKCMGENLSGKTAFTVPAGQTLTSYIQFTAKMAQGYTGDDVKQNHDFPNVEIARAPIAVSEAAE